MSLFRTRRTSASSTIQWSVWDCRRTALLSISTNRQYDRWHLASGNADRHPTGQIERKAIRAACHSGGAGFSAGAALVRLAGLKELYCANFANPVSRHCFKAIPRPRVGEHDMIFGSGLLVFAQIHQSHGFEVMNLQITRRSGQIRSKIVYRTAVPSISSWRRWRREVYPRPAYRTATIEDLSLPENRASMPGPPCAFPWGDGTSIPSRSSGVWPIFPVAADFPEFVDGCVVLVVPNAVQTPPHKDSYFCSVCGEVMLDHESKTCDPGFVLHRSWRSGKMRAVRVHADSAPSAGVDHRSTPE